MLSSYQFLGGALCATSVDSTVMCPLPHLLCSNICSLSHARKRGVLWQWIKPVSLQTILLGEALWAGKALIYTLITVKTNC